MNTETDFAIAALRLEQHYSDTDNEDLLVSLGHQESDALPISTLESRVYEFLTGKASLAGHLISSAVFALGKTYKNEYLGLYTQLIEQYLEQDILIVYQAGIAIENLGFSIFQSAGPYDSPDLVTKRASEYLQAQAHNKSI
ncbi:hypothetical protein CBX96_11265 [Shewanella sp. BC20]|uniref:hypothetical protein n=1 Tax=Shewanella sp. BC20 TaxID=2004459 RepID=UPI000D64F648|nr:hypothetical protein [Shewanella sp. BC20]PWF63384.1 hypothetical protein CBX96_11265 [Shewanella sp. BC20]